MNHVKSFNIDQIFFTPIGPCRFYVLAGDKPYAGYDSNREAEDAIELWKKYWPVAQQVQFKVVRRF